MYAIRHLLSEVMLVAAQLQVRLEHLMVQVAQGRRLMSLLVWAVQRSDGMFFHHDHQVFLHSRCLLMAWIVLPAWLLMEHLL